MAELTDIERILGEAEQATSAGDHGGAERSLRRALRLQEASVGLVHPDVANTLNDLGVVCDHLGRPDEAEFLYRRALGIARRTLEPDHPYITTSLENLSNLYEAQGRPEKLAKARDGGSSGSGLPEIDSDDGFDEVDPAEAMPPGPVSAPEAPAIPAELQSLQQRPSLLPSGWFANPFVLAGIGVVIFAGGWLLFGGGDDPAGPRQPREDATSTGTQSQASAGDRALVGADTNTPSASAERSTAVARDSTEDSASAAEAEQRTVSAAEALSATAPLSNEGPAAAPDLSTPTRGGELNADEIPAVAASSVVAAAQLCRQLETRSPDGAPLAEWRCEPVSDQARTVPAQLFFYTRIRLPTSATVAHRWLRNGVLEQQIDLDIGANNGAGYRTYSSHTVSSQQTGTWRVELWSGDQTLLYAEEFVAP